MKALFRILTVMLVAVAAYHPASAQSNKNTKQAETAAEIKQLIDAKNYVFQATYMYPSGGSARYLTSPYDLTVAPDTVQTYLPYFGVAYFGVGYNNPDDSGIKFTSTKFDYNTKVTKKGNYNINIHTNDTRSAVQLILNVYNNGNADLLVISTNRQQIRFTGYIKDRKKN